MSLLSRDLLFYFSTALFLIRKNRAGGGAAPPVAWCVLRLWLRHVYRDKEVQERDIRQSWRFTC
jgi:hypothetical protein